MSIPRTTQILTDRLGTPLRPGNRVSVELVVIEGETDWMQVETTSESPGGIKSRMTLHSSQVEKLPDTQRRLHFITPVDIPVGELRTTIRRGHKWLPASGVIELCLDEPRGTHRVLGKAEIIDTKLVNFNKILSKDIERYASLYVKSQQRGTAHQLSIIREELRVAYPGFADFEICTVLLFKRIE
jgi:hypothetical protein